MTIGERFVKELLSRGMPREVLTYEQLQHLKTLDGIGELRTWLSGHLSMVFDDSDEISDIVDQALIPCNRRLFWTKKKAWALTVLMGVFAIVMIVFTKTTSIFNVFYVVFPVAFWYAGQKLLRERIRNPKYLVLVGQKDA